MAYELAGGGRVQALGGVPPSRGFTGGAGRIRIEATIRSSSLLINPDPSVVALSDGSLPQIWMPENGPSVRIVSVGGLPSPNDPRAGFNAVGADVALPRIATTPVLVETTNVEQASAVRIRVTPRANGDYTETTAAVTDVISTTPLVIRWTANVPINDGYSAIQAKVVRP